MSKRRKIRRTKRPAKPKRIRVRRSTASPQASKHAARHIVASLRKKIRVKRTKLAPKRDVRKRIIKVLRGKKKAPRKIKVKHRRTPKRTPKRRKRIKRLPPPKPPKAPPKAKRPQEWLVTFTYQASGRTVDFIVVAFEDTDAAEYAHDELIQTPDGEKMLRHFMMQVIPFKPPRYRNIADVGEVEER